MEDKIDAPLVLNDTKSETTAPIKPAYPLYTKRYLILFLFTMAELCNTVVYATCNPIAGELSAIYHKEGTFISLSATLYLFMHPAFTFQASYLIMFKGNASSVKLGALLTLIGIGLRLFVRQSFVWVLVGQTFSGIGRPFIINAQAAVAVEWFPVNERTKLMTMLNFIVTFAGILGYIIPPIFFAGYKVDENNQQNLDQGDHLFMLLLISQAIFAAIFLIPLLFIYESKPKSPPGPVHKSEDISFKKSIIKMFKNYKFLLIFTSFTLYYGTYKGYGVALVYLLMPWGYGKSDIAFLSAAPVIGGFISSLMVPALYKKWKRYKPLIIILEFLTIVAFFAFIYACYLQNIYLMLIIAVVQGFMLLPAIPLLLEWGCEEIFPLNDSFCIGLMYSGATMGSSFIGQFLVFLVDGNHCTKWQSFTGISVICGLYLVAILSVLFLREVKHKLAAKKSFVSAAERVEDDFPHPYPEMDPNQFGLYDQVEDADDLVDNENDQGQDNNQGGGNDNYGGNDD